MLKQAGILFLALAAALPAQSRRGPQGREARQPVRQEQQEPRQREAARPGAAIEELRQRMRKHAEALRADAAKLRELLRENRPDGPGQRGLRAKLQQDRRSPGQRPGGQRGFRPGAGPVQRGAGVPPWMRLEVLRHRARGDGPARPRGDAARPQVPERVRAMIRQRFEAREQPVRPEGREKRGDGAAQ